MAVSLPAVLAALVVAGPPAGERYLQTASGSC